jgi:hypothetical protein
VANLQIIFIGDLPGTPPARTLLVANDQDYCAAAVELRRDLAAGYDSIWIRLSHHFTWVQSLVEHVGISHERPTAFIRTTARDLLASKWKLTIPDWLTDEMILTENLLDRELPPGTHEHVASALLAPFIGNLSAAFPRANAGVLPEKASAPAFQSALAASAINKAAWENTLSTWAANDPTSWVNGFCERMRASPKKLWSDLTVWRLLEKYPTDALEFALEPAAVTFVRSVPTDVLKDMSLNEDGRMLALDQIQTILEQARNGIATRTRFEGLLAAVSGELKEEFEGLEAVLAMDKFKPERLDVDTIARRFKLCPDITPASLAKLELYIRPPQPGVVDPTTADAAAWLKWFHAGYVPYRLWQTQRMQTDGAVEATVGAFSEWYCRDFIKVHGNPAYSAVQTITQWRPCILQDSISLILLVDNLPWFFWNSFERALATAGLHKHESSSRFVPLPSHTSVCKPAIVSGRWDAAGCDYGKMLETRSAEEWSGRPVQYLSGVDQLAVQKEFSTPRVFLLNYLASDEALHSDSAAAGTTHAEELALRYKSLSQAVGEFARRAGQQGRKFGLYVLTDHGATLILPPETKSIDAQLTKRLFPNEKYRSATLTAAEASAVPENLWELGFRFTNPCFPADAVYFIPRGHNTVASLSKQVYCHGGATPEEVIVPTGVFRLFRANWVEPAVRFLIKLKDGRAPFYVKRMANVEFEIQNTNSDECRLEAVIITPNVGDIRDFSRVAVAPNSVGKGTVSLYFAASATTTTLLVFDFRFRLAQEILTRRVELPVAISSAASTGTDLTNLLS